MDWYLRSLASLLFILILASPGARSQDVSPEREVYLRFSVQAVPLQNLGQILSLDRISGDTVYAYASPLQYPEFLQYGIDHEVLPLPSFENAELTMSSTLNLKSALMWNTYPTYPAYETMMTGFQQLYPSLCRFHVLGTLPSGRRILALRITDHPDSTEAEPQFLYTSSMHGDELVGYVLMLRFADYLLSNYATDPDIQRLVDSIDIWINPLANPDGTYRSGNTTVAGASRYNANWVDINRNFPDPEDGPHPDGYAWQPETQIFMNFASANRFSMSCNIHGGAEVCNYPWDTWYAWQKLHPDDAWWQYVCNEYADTAQLYSPSGYLDDFGTGVIHGATWYSIDGGRQDYMNYFHRCREFTLEISAAKLPSASLLPNFWNYNYRSLLNYLAQSLRGVSGTVTDSLTGLPLRAKVLISGHDADSSHVYSGALHGDYYRYLPSGTYNISFICPGYDTKTLNGVAVTQGQPLELDVALKPESFTISGQVIYANTLQTLLPNSWVFLFDTLGNPLDTTVSDTAGNFAFELRQRGKYILKANPQIVWGGVNTADALAAMTHFAQLDTIPAGLARQAADVNLSGSINSTDALLIQRRFVGLMNSFPVPDWISEEPVVFLEPQVNVVIRLICAGDANSSNNP
jgi:hypothetical protein